MPILPENRSRYPENWSEISLAIIERDHYKCKKCGVHHHAVGYRDENGKFNPCCGNWIVDHYGIGQDPHNGGLLSYKMAKAWALWETENDEMDHKYIVIVLTIAHLDHTPENCSDRNLAALCQKCHNTYDAPHRAQTRKRGKYYGMNQLFK
jgi:5-methylcytosine-specific restriction endonuclease McrA